MTLTLELGSTALRGLDLATRPSNDDYANFIDLGSAISGTRTDSNRYATTEAGENTGTSGWQTVWYKWVAPFDGDFTFSLFQSRAISGRGFSSVVSIYTQPGSTIADLVNVTFNNVAPFAPPFFENGAASFTAVASTAYYISVGGTSDSSGVSDALNDEESTGFIFNWNLNADGISRLFMLGAVGDARVYGPSISISGAEVIPLALTAMDADAAPLGLGLLSTKARTFRAEENDTGDGSFAVPLDDADFASLDFGQLINFKVYDAQAWTMLLESVQYSTLVPGEWHDRLAVLSGRGHLALWEHAVVWPFRGTDVVPVEEDRPFNWTSPAPVYDDTGWLPAKVVGDYPIAGHGSGNGIWFFSFTDFPADAGADIIWVNRADVSGTWAPIGFIWVRANFIVPPGVTKIIIYCAADDRARVFFDGHEVMNFEQAHAFPVTAVTIDVSPGPHLLAVEAQNFPDTGVVPGQSTTVTTGSDATYTVVPGDTLWGIAQSYYGSGYEWRTIYDANQAQIQSDAESHGLWNPNDPGHWIFPGQVFTIPGAGGSTTTTVVTGAPTYVRAGGLAYAVYSTTVGLPETLLLKSDTSAKAVGYLDAPPGITPGRAIRVLRDEANLRGALLGLTLGFDDHVDSNGLAWPEYANISTRVGNDYLRFLKELCVAYIDMWMVPGTLQLNAYVRGTHGAVRDVTLQTTSSISGSPAEPVQHAMAAIHANGPAPALFVDLPSTPTEGNLLLALVQIDIGHAVDATDWAPPAGWTIIGATPRLSANSMLRWITAGWRLVGPSESATIDLGIGHDQSSGGHGWVAAVYEYDQLDVDTADPVLAVDTANTDTGSFPDSEVETDPHSITADGIIVVAAAAFLTQSSPLGTGNYGIGVDAVPTATVIDHGGNAGYTGLATYHTSDLVFGSRSVVGDVTTNHIGEHSGHNGGTIIVVTLKRINAVQPSIVPSTLRELTQSVAD